jgi:hypothetical protein
MKSDGVIPAHLRESLEAWYGRELIHQQGPFGFEPGPPPVRVDLLRTLEREMRLPLPWEGNDPGRTALAWLIAKAMEHGDIALHLIEALLVIEKNEHNARELAEILDSPDSRWAVSGLDGSATPTRPSRLRPTSG